MRSHKPSAPHLVAADPDRYRDPPGSGQASVAPDVFGVDPTGDAAGPAGGVDERRAAGAPT